MKRQSFISSVAHAVNGIIAAAGNERNFLIQLVAVIIITAMGIIFSVSPVQWMVIIACFGLVLSLELINTALEKLADAVTAEYHPLIKQAKDIAAGAVLLASVASVTIGFIIFIPEIKKML